MKFPGVICILVGGLCAYQGYLMGEWMSWAWAIIFTAVGIDMVTHGASVKR